MSKKILIIDDEPQLLNVLVDKFVNAGFVVLTAVDGKQGLDVAFKNHPDLILLDIIMPIMDGISMLRELRRDSWGKLAKVYLLTNLSDPGISDAPTNTVCGYLVKTDWKISDLVKQVKKSLS
jgi:DNA-binding response OmpR family regulator